jgi:hypothetical protein
MKVFIVSLLSIFLMVISTAASASAIKPKPGQKSTNCYYNFGPKVGQEEDLAGRSKPVLIGKPCKDGEGSTGISVISKEEEEAEEAEEAAKSAGVKAQAAKKQAEANIASSTVCQFNQGPRAGQAENYTGKIAPQPLGSECTDGLRSVGKIIAE